MNAITKDSSNALTLPPAARAAVVLKSEQTRKELAELVKQSAGIVTISNKDGREEAHRAAMTLKNTRVAIKNAGEMAREDAVAFSKAVIKEAGDLVSVIEPEERRVLGLRDGWDEKIAAEKAAKIAAERARVEAIQADIDRLRAIPAKLIGKSSDDLAFARKDMLAMVVDEARFAEFTETARTFVADVIARIELMLTAELEREQAARAAEESRKAEEGRLAAERAELARQREEQAETARLAKVESDRIAIEQAAEGKRIADLLAAQEAELRLQREVEAARVRAEDETRAAAYAEQQAAFEVQRAAFAREQEEAAQREADRVRLHTIVEEARADVDALPASLDELMAATFTTDDLPLAEPLAMPESITLRDALIDAGVEFEVPDEEIIKAAIEAVVELGLTRDVAIERLAAIKFVAAREAVA